MRALIDVKLPQRPSLVNLNVGYVPGFFVSAACYLNHGSLYTVSLPASAIGQKERMDNQIKAVIVDDETISIDGRTLLDRDALVDALGSALQRDPGVILVIAPQKNEYYKGIGKVIYASQYVGFPVENLRYTMEDGDVVSFDELRARSAQ